MQERYFYNKRRQVTEIVFNILRNVSNMKTGEASNYDYGMENFLNYKKILSEAHNNECSFLFHCYSSKYSQ